MRTVVYISRASGHWCSNLSADLAKIVAQSRAFNAKHNITGLISFRNGHYLQALEGEHGAVESLLSRIGADKRHHDLSIIVDQPSLSRFFKHWSMKLAASSGMPGEFERLLQAHRGSLAALPPTQVRILNAFRRPASAPMPPAAELRDKELKLRKFPRVGDSADFAVLDLIATLTQRWLSWAELEKTSGLTADELYSHLAGFHRQDLLQHRPAPPDNRLVAEAPAQSNKSPQTFYGRLRSAFMRLA